MTQEEKAKRYDEAIERAKKWYNAPNVFYDIYHGFSSWFKTKWMIDKGGLTESEVIDYLKPYIASGGVKIIIE